MTLDATGAANQIALQNSMIIQLWTVYVAATFAMAGFAFLADAPPTCAVRIAVTLGFWAFALGHLALLNQTLRTARAFANDLKSAISKGDETGDGFKSSLDMIVLSANKPGYSIGAHLVIDLCATAALWLR